MNRFMCPVWLLPWLWLQTASAAASCSGVGPRQCHSSSLLQVKHRLKQSTLSAIAVLSWDGAALAEVQQALADPDSAPSWALAAQRALLRRADRVKELPAGLRSGVPAGPWSPTQKKLTPPSGDKRDYMTCSGYAWPCTTKCSDTGYDQDKCQLWDVGKRTFGDCDASTGKPWVIHDGFLNYDGLQDLNIMIIAMDTLETLTLAYWFSPGSPDQPSYAQAAMRVFRAYFLDNSTRMNPRFLYGGSLPGKYDTGTAGDLIAPGFRMNSRFVDCATLLQLAGPDVWTDADTAAWRAWVQDWSTWLQTSVFGKHEMKAVGNHATFQYVHRLALDHVTGDDAHALDLIGKLRYDFAGSLTEQIEPTGEMPIETARVTGAIYSMMNINGLFLLGTVVDNLCKRLPCNPAWSWAWQAPAPSSPRWEKHANKISYCRFKGHGSLESVDACKSSCLENDNCNGVVTRTAKGSLRGCYFKDCPGTEYDLRDPGAGSSTYDSYHRVAPPPEGSGSLRKAVDYLLPYALGEKKWTDDHKGTSKEDWKPLAPVLRRAAVVFGEPSYEDKVKALDGDFHSHLFNLLFAQPPESDS